MTTIDDLIDEAARDRDEARGLAAGANRRASSLRARLDRGENVSQSDVDEAVRALERANATVRAQQDRLDELHAERARDEAAAALAREFRPVAAERSHTPGARSTVSVTSPRTYSAQAERAGDGPSFLLDLYRAQVKSDPAALARLNQHGEEVRAEAPAMYERAVSTGGVAGFVPPQYLVNLFAEYLRAGRPTANQCTHVPLPERGMQVHIPRVTTGSSAGVQASENSAVSNNDPDDTDLTVPVVTVGGYVDASRQSLERGELVEQVLLADLAGAYSAALDLQVLNGSGSSGQHTGVLNVSSINLVTYTDASPTVPKLWPKLADALGRVVSTRYTGPTAIIMHPSVWAWMLSEKDSTGRPLIGAGDGAAVNSVGLSGTNEYGATGRTLLGVPVVLDGNMPTNLGSGTNETRIVVADFRDVLLLEDAAGPVQLRFDGPGSSTLTSRLVVYGYSALAVRQPSAVSVISGTGLIVPAL